MRNSTIIILRGNSGSGKSTVAKNLQRELGHGTFLISQDVVRREMIFVHDEPNNQSIDLLIDLVKWGQNNCNIVILEGILRSKTYERLFEIISSEFGNNIFAYYFDLPFEETLKRHNTRDKSKEFGEEALRKWWTEKDYLPQIQEKRITQDLAMVDIINLIKNDLSKEMIIC
jgi:adenylate kinase family enzyme